MIGFRRRTLSGAGIRKGNCLVAHGRADSPTPALPRGPDQGRSERRRKQDQAPRRENAPEHFGGVPRAWFNTTRTHPPTSRPTGNGGRQALACRVCPDEPPGWCLAHDGSDDLPGVTKGHHKATGRPLPPPPIPLPNTTPPRPTTGAVLLLGWCVSCKCVMLSVCSGFGRLAGDDSGDGEICWFASGALCGLGGAAAASTRRRRRRVVAPRAHRACGAVRGRGV